MTSPRPQIIFFGNGPLADYALPILKQSCDIIFHARTKEDLTTVKDLKSQNASLYGVLASFGVIIKSDVLELFEPDGILDIHPSLLPKYRGPSPIESAILNGDTTLGVSVMKLVSAMDAGPIYHQKSFDFSPTSPKDEIYRTLSEHGASWIANSLNQATSSSEKAALSTIFTPVSQDDSQATYTQKLTKSLSPLDPTSKSASELLNQIRAFAGFPKSKYNFFGLDCTIISAHVATPDEAAAATKSSPLYLHCNDDSILIIDQIQPAGRKIMDAKSFINGYAK